MKPIRIEPKPKTHLTWIISSSFPLPNLRLPSFFLRTFSSTSPFVLLSYHLFSSFLLPFLSPNEFLSTKTPWPPLLPLSLLLSFFFLAHFLILISPLVRGVRTWVRWGFVNLNRDRDRTLDLRRRTRFEVCDLANFIIWLCRLIVGGYNLLNSSLDMTKLTYEYIHVVIHYILEFIGSIIREFLWFREIMRDVPIWFLLDEMRWFWFQSMWFKWVIDVLMLELNVAHVILLFFTILGLAISVFRW